MILFLLPLLLLSKRCINFIARFQDSDMEMSSSNDELESSEDVEQDESGNEGIDSEVEVVDNVKNFDEDWRLIAISVQEADPVCRRLDRLIKTGQIPKDKIFYKYFSDVVEILYNPLHRYDEDVKEFFATLTYLGGKSTYYMIRGPMLIGTGHSSSAELKMNLGGPSGETLRKRQAAYTTMSGVLKCLSLLNYKLTSCENSSTKAAPLIENESLLVYPAAIGNNGTALKPAIQFDERAKEIIGLHYTVDLEYVKNNRLLSKETLQNNLVCEALVSSITSLDNSCSLPVAVTYATKAGKSGSEIKKLFTEQIKVLQLCENCQRR